MKGIKCCAECADYSLKKHKCTRGAKDPGKASDSFYADCPLDDAESVRHGKPLTNGDRIRQMTDEELAEWLDLHGECNQCAYHPVYCKTECNEGHLKWLKQEVSEDAFS